MIPDAVPGPIYPHTQPTPAELEESHRQYRKQQHQSVWMNYSLIAMQIIKAQADQFDTAETIAEKAAKLADCMLQQFVLRE